MPPKRFNGPRPAADKPKKTRKPSKPKEKPEGMSNANWVKLVTRNVENDSRRDREKIQKEKQEALAWAEEKSQPQGSTHAGGMYPPHHGGQFFPGGVWGSQSSASPTHYTPSPQAMFQEAGAHTTTRTRFSPPEYEGNQLGGFNPNIVVPGMSPALRRRHFHQFGASSASAGSLFDGMPGESVMHMIVSDSAAVASAPGYFTQEEARTATKSGLDTQDFGTNEDEDGGSES